MTLIGRLFREKLHEGEVGKFITFQDEKVLLGVREHNVFLVFRIIKIIFATGVVAILFSLIAGFFLQSVFLMMFTLFLITFTGLNFILQEVVHWYFHMYIVTNRKILEVKYHPLISEITNSVLLDQIKCTEIDAELYGFIPELLDMGDVKITFDRPTHQEEFALRNIRSPRRVANTLSADLNKNNREIIDKNSQGAWYKDRNTNKLRYVEQNYGYSAN